MVVVVKVKVVGKSVEATTGTGEAGPGGLGLPTSSSDHLLTY